MSATAKAPVNFANIKTQYIEVTPKIAAEWLEKNEENRDIRDRYVMTLARQIKAGELLLTPEPIIFDEHGVLLNGQHRLWAVLMANTSCWFTVSWGWPTKIKTKIDHPQLRTTKDIFALSHGERVITLAVTITRHLLKYIIMRNPTDDEHLRFYKAYQEGIDYVCQKGFGRRTTRGVTTASVGAVIARAWFTSDRDRLQEFCDVLISGMPKNTGADDRAALVLRRFLTEPKQKVPGKNLAVTITAKTETALQRFLLRQDLTHAYEASQEFFPLPREERWRKEFAKPLLEELRPEKFPWRQKEAR